MLHSYSVSNFRSFKDRVHVSFLLNEKDSVLGWARTSPRSGYRLSTALAVLGANASGKTSLLQPLAFIGWFVRSSFSAQPDAGIAIKPHFSSQDSPSEFELVCDGIEGDELFRYTLSATRTEVIFESLERKVRRGAWQSIFTRAKSEPGKYRVTQSNFGLDDKQAENLRPNVSLISWAAQFGVPLALQICDFTLLSNVNAWGRIWTNASQALEKSTKLYAENEVMRARMKELLGKWDLGLSDIMIEEFKSATENGDTNKTWLPIAVHLDKNQNKHLLGFYEESSGTQAAYTLLTLVLPVLQFGGVLVFDELDADLHPHLLEPMLALFSNEESNPHGAQIIFTCHAPEVLRFLQKSQIVLTEKDETDSHAWRLDELEGVRIEDNRIAKYLAGAYGAVPRL